MDKALAALALAGATIAAASARPQQAPPDLCRQPLPAGFVADMSWQGPWAYATTRRSTTPLPRLDNAAAPHQTASMSLAIRLDDGRQGTITVESTPYDRQRDGDPRDDCGCFEDDGYWLHVKDARGRPVADLHLWAAYGLFQIVPVDLIDGPGDELLIFRVPAHSSPPAGYDLKIWKIGKTAPIDLGGERRIAACLGTVPVCCARGRNRVYINLSSPKPRSIVLKAEIGALPCCRIVQDGDPAEGIHPFGPPGAERTLGFDLAARRYRE